MNLLLAMHEPFAVSYYERRLNATEQEKESAFSLFGDFEAKPIHSVNGSVARMNIEGPLSRSGPDFLDMLFGYGGTAYSAIIDASTELAADDAVEDVDVYMNTPGGGVDGLDEAYQALARLAESKTVRIINTGMVASAGYYLAVAGHRIDAVSPAVDTGSIGVKIAGFDFTQALEARGIKRVVLLSENAPNKDTTLATELGRSTLKEELNAHERIFHQRIVEGRGVSLEKVRKDFGRGAVMVAFDPDPDKPDAISVGMIDGIIGGQMREFGADGDENSGGSAASTVPGKGEQPKPGKSTERRAAKTLEIQKMNLLELLAAHPAAAAEHQAALEDAKKLGFADGQTKGAADAKADFESRSAMVKVAMDSEKNYPKSVRELAGKVLTGDASVDALQTTIASVDAVREESASAAAAAETAAQGGTQGEQHGGGKAEGVAENEQDFNAQVAQTQSSLGMNGKD